MGERDRVGCGARERERWNIIRGRGCKLEKWTTHLILHPPNPKHQTPQLLKLRLANTQQPRRLVHSRPSSLLVGLEGVGGDHD